MSMVERVGLALAAWRTRLRRRSVLVPLGLTVLLAVYLVGWLQGRSAVAVLRTEHVREIAVQQQEMEGLQADVRAQKARRLIRDAQVALYQAAFELERRNFGSAQDQVRKASDFLQSVRAGDARISTVEFDRARNAVRDLNVLVAEDVSSQRTQLLGLARALDLMIQSSAG